MKENSITCSMCGYIFDPAAHTACQRCPLNRNCQLVCCPVCGFETVDTSRSTLARIVARWLGTTRPKGPDALQATQKRGR